jgi:squalene-associated FAD-dependent desaturase
VSPRIAVIGGGLAGMSAALTAADGGAEVVLIERRAVLGGLTSSIKRGDLSFDNGQHIFLRCCSAYRAFLDRIDATSHTCLQDRMRLPVIAPGGKRSDIFRMAAPAPLHLAASLARYRHLSLADKVRLVGPVLALRKLSLEDPALDEETFASWLARRHQSDRAVANLWELICLPTLNLPAREASLALAAMVFRVGLLEHGDAGDIGWSAVPLGELHGALPAKALAASGVETLLGVPASSVTADDAGGFEVLVGSRRIRTDAVILALPPRPAMILAGEPSDATVDALGTSPIVNVHLVLDRKVTDLPLAACVGSPLQFFFDRTATSGATSGQVLSVSLSAAREHMTTPSDELVRGFFSALCDILPGAGRARLVDGVVTRERSATFRAAPGSAALRPGPATAAPGLLLAGAWCDTGWPATMEGAVRSGMKAAALALAADPPAEANTLKLPTHQSRLEEARA